MENDNNKGMSRFNSSKPHETPNSDSNNGIISNKQVLDKIDDIDEKFFKVLESQREIIERYEAENSDLKNKIKTTKELSQRNDEIFSRYNYILDSFSDLVADYKNENEELKKGGISSKPLLDKIEEMESKFNDVKNENAKLSKEIRAANKKLSDNDKVLESNYKLLNLLLLEYELHPKGLLKQLRLLTQEMMVFLRNICEKHDLSIWLDYGTLLGAVRHQGFIPWDDDIDLAMMRKDFDRFLEAFKEETARLNLEDQVILIIDQAPTKNLMISFIKITFDYIKLADIFPYDYIDTPEISKELYLSERSKFHVSLLKGNPKKDAVEQCFKNLNLLYEDGNYIIPGVEGVIGSLLGYPLTIREKDIIFPLQEMQFENIDFPCPKDYDSYLRGIYGKSYKSTPKTIRDHNLLNRLRRRATIEEDLAHALEVMKNANQNF